MKEIKNIWREELEKAGWKLPENCGNRDLTVVDAITKTATDIIQPYLMECVKCHFVIGACQYDAGGFIYRPKHCVKQLERELKVNAYAQSFEK